MTGNGQDATAEVLNLRSRMSDLSQIHAWIERLASLHSIPSNTQFAMNLCLEEVLSNIIRHGYSGESGRPMSVRFASPREDEFVLVVEDQAPPFNPVDSPELPALHSLDDIQVGGQGIRLLRHFAGALEYLETPTGNRLIIRFSSAGAAVAKD